MADDKRVQRAAEVAVDFVVPFAQAVIKIRAAAERDEGVALDAAQTKAVLEFFKFTNEADDAVWGLVDWVKDGRLDHWLDAK